jgi:hypothetical protein
MANTQELKSDYDEAFEIKRTGWERQLKQGMLDLDFYFRAQHTHEEARQAELQNRTLYTLDKIGRQVDLLHGYEIKNRHILRIGPQGKPSVEDKACSQHTNVLMNLMVMANGYNVLSEAFKWGPLVQGSNLIEIWRDRNGDLRFSRLGWNQFLLNPGLTETDLSDCQDIAIGRWIDEKRIKFLLPANSDDLDEITPLTNVSRWDFLQDPVLQNRAKRMLMEEWWQRETEFEETVISRVSGQEIPLKDFATRFANGDIRLAKRMVKEERQPNGAPALSRFSKPNDRIRLTIFVNNKMVFDGDNPLGMRDYNFVWVHGDWCAECPRDDIKLQSHTRRLRDPQSALNRRTNQIYDIIESQAHAVRLTRSSKLRNPEDAYKTGQGVVLHANEEWPDELPLEQLFKQMPASDVPAGLFAALEMTDKAETEVGGLNQEIFGTDDKDIPAILAKHRTGQALTGQGGMFQGFRMAKRELGRKVVRLVQINYPPQKVAQIINEQPVPGFYEKNLTRFDCAPVEGLLTDSQQELFFMLLLQIRQAFPKEAHKIPLSEVAKYSSIMKEELMGIIQRAEQKEAQMMQQAQKTQQIQEALNIELTKGNVLANRGIAEERRSQAVENQTDAALNRVKVVAEINDMTIGRFLELVNSAISLESIGQQNIKAEMKS